jgi:hypothetical protein
MAKALWEDEARDRFVTFLHETAGASYRTDAEDVSEEGGKNFDYLSVRRDILPLSVGC